MSFLSELSQRTWDAPNPVATNKWFRKDQADRRADAPDMSANQMFAEITRKQWADYVQNYIPIENQLIAYATDPSVPGQAMAKASDNVNAAFDQQQGAVQRRLASMGTSLSPDERKAYDRSSAVSRSLTDVQAQNLAGTATRERQASLLGNPAPDITAAMSAAK